MVQVIKACNKIRYSRLCSVINVFLVLITNGTSKKSKSNTFMNYLFVFNGVHKISSLRGDSNKFFVKPRKSLATKKLRLLSHSFQSLPRHTGAISVFYMQFENTPILHLQEREYFQTFPLTEKRLFIIPRVLLKGII
jgi:hypothetical protein